MSSLLFHLFIFLFLSLSLSMDEMRPSHPLFDPAVIPVCLHYARSGQLRLRFGKPYRLFSVDVFENSTWHSVVTTTFIPIPSTFSLWRIQDIASPFAQKRIYALPFYHCRRRDAVLLLSKDLITQIYAGHLPGRGRVSCLRFSVGSTKSCSISPFPSYIYWIWMGLFQKEERMETMYTLSFPHPFPFLYFPYGYGYEFVSLTQPKVMRPWHMEGTKQCLLLRSL